MRQLLWYVEPTLCIAALPVRHVTGSPRSAGSVNLRTCCRCLWIAFLALQQTIVKENACLACADQAGCANVYFGVLTKGTFAAIQTYTNMFMDLLATLGTTAGLDLAGREAVMQVRWFRSKSDQNLSQYLGLASC